ncbi:MAG TPA: MBL fold metallo-hydrolase [Verrucomicrobiae bacterium]|nr:MBL fold metallo-hydrolase [Verrucomicrobiae bacterium]
MKRKVWAILGIISLVALLAPFAIPQPSRLWVLSIGQGASILYRDQTGKTFLYDGGPDDTVLTELGRILPPWRRSINVLALSHTHADHVRGLIPVVERYAIDEVWESGALAPGNDIARWRELITEKHITKRILFAGTHLPLGLADLFTIHPLVQMEGKKLRDAHDANLAFQLTTGTHRILLTGDLDERHEKSISTWCRPPGCNLKSEVLQIPHHGSATGLAPPFLELVDPKMAFICVGQNNKFKHPRPNILQLLEEKKVPYHRTDRDGGLKITFRAGQLSYEKTRSVPR